MSHPSSWTRDLVFCKFVNSQGYPWTPMASCSHAYRFMCTFDSPSKDTYMVNLGAFEPHSYHLIVQGNPFKEEAGSDSSRNGFGCFGSPSTSINNMQPVMQHCATSGPDKGPDIPGGFVDFKVELNLFSPNVAALFYWL